MTKKKSIKGQTDESITKEKLQESTNFFIYAIVLGYEIQGVKFNEELGKVVSANLIMPLSLAKGLLKEYYEMDYIEFINRSTAALHSYFNDQVSKLEDKKKAEKIYLQALIQLKIVLINNLVLIDDLDDLLDSSYSISNCDEIYPVFVHVVIQWYRNFVRSPKS